MCCRLVLQSWIRDTLVAEMFSTVNGFHSTKLFIIILQSSWYADLLVRRHKLCNDLFLRNISESPLCLCGNVENTEHYFMHCRIYEAQPAELSQTVSQYFPFTLETLLFGNNTLPLNINIFVVDADQTYIKDTTRF